MQRLWFRFVTTSPFVQLFVVILASALMTAAFTYVIYLTASDPRQFSVELTLMELLTNRGSDETWMVSFAYYTIIVFFVAVWQAAFIARIMNAPNKLRFSKHASFYPAVADHRDPLKRDPYIVFRLINIGINDLYDLNIRATVRVFDAVSQTFQHYKCNIRNSYIPILMRGMPFRIYIETGEIREAVDVSFLDPYNVLQPENGYRKIISKKYVIDQIEQHHLDKMAFSIILYVEGKDSKVDQLKSAVQRYAISDLKYGFFTSIEPRKHKNKKYRGREQYRFFSHHEIAKNFDKIENEYKAEGALKEAVEQTEN